MNESMQNEIKGIELKIKVRDRQQQIEQKRNCLFKFSSLRKHGTKCNGGGQLLVVTSRLCECETFIFFRPISLTL